MKDNIKLFLKGCLMGISNIIPGVSGGTLAIILGIYERLISSISNFFSNFRSNIKFLLILGLGMGTAILVSSNVISFCLDNYKFATIMLFIGIIIGGFRPILNKVKGNNTIYDYLVMLITFTFVILLGLFRASSNINLDTLNLSKYIFLFISGLLASSSMLLPGISGSFVLMLLGVYEPIVDVISDLTKFNNIIKNGVILISLGLGILCGVILMAKIIEYLVKNHEKKMYFAIIGFILASIISIFKTAISTSVNLPEIIVGLLLLILGIFISRKIGEENE